MTTSQLYELCKDHMREPWFPKSLYGFSGVVNGVAYTDWYADSGQQYELDADAAEQMILGAAVRYLLCEGYRRHEWDRNIDTDQVVLTLYDHEFTGRNELATVLSACKWVGK